MNRTTPGIIVLVLALSGAAAACGSAAGRSPAAGDQTITTEDLRNPNEPIERVLERKVPGLSARRNEAGELVLTIRGTTHYEARDTPPLYIMDNLPFQPGPGGAISGLDPEDILTVKVLKGSDAVIYGIDGANGVIVITTKRGKPRN